MGDLNSASRAASVAQWVEYMSRTECHGVAYHLRQQLGKSIYLHLVLVLCCFVLHILYIYTDSNDVDIQYVCTYTCVYTCTYT